MITYLDCIPCFVRQALDAARFVSTDPKIHEKLLKHVLQRVSAMDLSSPPPVVAQDIQRTLTGLTGILDPYKEVKDRFNRLALSVFPESESLVAESEDPLYTAARLAIAGNIIDFGVRGDLKEEEVLAAMEQALSEPFYSDLELFRQELEQAERILYLADNAGEIVFDRLLVRRIGAWRTVVAVRGMPILNDATISDARLAGIADKVRVIENGSDAPGTILDDCSHDFRTAFDNADLIISKGQGNFETLSSQSDKKIAFLLKVKCPVIGAHLGMETGTQVLLANWK